MKKGINIVLENPAPGVEVRSTCKWASDQISYVNGGTEVTYPSDLFSDTPSVRVGVGLSGLSYSTDLIVSPIITANSTTGSTIYVNVYKGGSASEANSGDIILHVYAIH